MTLLTIYLKNKKIMKYNGLILISSNTDMLHYWEKNCLLKINSLQKLEIYKTKKNGKLKWKFHWNRQNFQIFATCQINFSALGL